jgi:hypothetical protein
LFERGIYFEKQTYYNLIIQNKERIKCKMIRKYSKQKVRGSSNVKERETERQRDRKTERERDRDPL